MDVTSLRLCLAGWLLLVATGIGSALETLPATAPASTAERFGQAARRGDFTAFRDHATRRIAAGGLDTTPDDPRRVGRVIEVVAYWRLAVMLGGDGDEAESHRAALSWLAEHPDTATALGLTLSDRDPPARVLAVLERLREDHEPHLDRRPELAAAFCVAWDELWDWRFSRPVPVDLQRVSRLYRYYRRGGNGRKQWVHDLPAQLAVYAINQRIAEDEALWARKRYRGHGHVGSLYFDVPFDHEAAIEGKPRRIAGNEYTLQNLLTLGGVWGDRAYFAAQVGKALGVPTAVAVGDSGAGEPPRAWIGWLNRDGRSRWDFTEGRDEALKFWSAEVRDPQTGESITDAEAALTAEYLRSSDENRRLGLALMHAAELFEPTKRHDLLRRSVWLCPANRGAWYALAELAAAGHLGGEQTNDLITALDKFALERYAEFAFLLYMRMLEGRSVEFQRTVLDRHLHGKFKGRPDLQAKIRLRQGDLHARQGRHEQARRQWRKVLEDHIVAGPVLLEAVDRLERSLRAAGRADDVLPLYAGAWSSVPQPRAASAYVRSTTWYVLGRRYVTLLEEAGRSRRADHVRARLNAMDSTIRDGGD